MNRTVLCDIDFCPKQPEMCCCACNGVKSCDMKCEDVENECEYATLVIDEGVTQ